MIQSTKSELVINLETAKALGQRSAETPFEFKQRLESASQELGITLLLAEHAPPEYASAFALIERERPNAILVPSAAADFGQPALDRGVRSKVPGTCHAWTQGIS